MKLQNIISGGRNWLSATPERALDQAYRAAIKIKAIEDDHFNGQPVLTQTMGYSDSVYKVFRTDVDNYLKTIKFRLTEFKLSRSFLIFSDTQPNNNQVAITYSNGLPPQPNLTIVEKLNFIDQIVSRYQNKDVIAVNSDSKITIDSAVAKNQLTLPKNNKNSTNPKNKDPNLETISDKTGVLPRSFMRTINRIKQEIDPQSETTEEEVLKKFRRSRNKTAISIRFLLILIIVPLMTHQIAKTFLVTPLVKEYFAEREQILFINKDLEEEAFIELRHYEENLHFQNLLGLAPRLSEEEVEIRLQEKAGEIAEEYREHGINAVSNVFSDIFSLIAFAGIIFACQKEIGIVKSFLDEIVYGLSDSAKAFLIILLTDMFVGYHSPHGWEVILEGIANHLGLPENRDFNFLFIATFPVILDTVLKYWIFRYLNRISPSSVATYKNMNE
ncbi:envelope membrane protein [Stanieria cyanosphaera PCC 7437]|uniref:Proton extrusion protein PxcA n=1 Tax=Stanieria cyanosphaera (strain ATCC 29371 / PCC 7437) TaxID=111780 RepID=K9XTN7_STAC7|nr:proton extrusion protein PcxA [Stanieria cyanosphaera]AFZ35441.1 envelope membrane protein [Stanieria cyanosphaera PCC 7437]